MGNLSNLYISQSFVSLIHLATNEAATATSTELQDGLGNGIGVYVNTAGELSSSVYSGSVAGIGNVSAFSASVSSRINAISASGGIPAGTVSSSAQITALGFATTASVDALSTSVDSRLDALEFADGTFVTTSSFASFTSSYFVDSSSVDSRLDALEAATSSYITSAQTSSMAVGSATSASYATNATNVNIATTGNNTDYYPTFTFGVGNQRVQIDSGNNFTYNPFTNKLTVVNVSATEITASGNISSSGNIYAANLTGSTIDTGSFATTGSNTFVGNQIINGAVTASVAQISGLNYPTADNGNKSFIQTDGAGNLSLQYVDAMFETVRNMSGGSLTKGTPVYISGSTGDNGNAYVADASDVNKMPAMYILGEDLIDGATGIALVSGLIEGVNTTGYPAGTEIYVAEGGGWSNVRPSGSESIVQKLGVVTKEGVGGQGVVINQLEAELPNLKSGFVWVGNTNNQPVTQSLTTLGFATTGSNSFSGSQIVSGSLVVTGSVKGNISTITISSDTASIDFSLGSFFNLQLVSSSVPTFVTATNVKAGTTANLLVTQASTLSGSLRWDSNFKFPSGSSYTGSVSSSAKDIVSFVMYDDTTIYSVGAKNLI